MSLMSCNLNTSFFCVCVRGGGGGAGGGEGGEEVGGAKDNLTCLTECVIFCPLG